MAKKRMNIDKELLRKYLDGELRGEEAYELERIILARKFDSEAQEGLDSLSGDQFAADISALEDKIDQRTSSTSQKSSKNNSYFARIAAAILIIAVSGYFIYDYVLNTAPMDDLMAQAEESPLGEETPTLDSLSNEIAMDSGFIALNDVEMDVEEAKPELDKALEENNTQAEPVLTQQESSGSGITSEELIAEDAKIIEEVTETSQEVVAEDLIAQDLTLNKADSSIFAEEKKAEESQTLLRTTAEARSKSAAAAPSSVTLDDMEEEANLLINGTVTATGESEPLPGASIIVKGTSVSAISNIDGNFTLSVPRGETIVASYAGFNSRELTITDSNDLNIRLDPNSSSLNEVIITAYGVNNQTKDVVNSNAQPSGGKQAFIQYVAENLKYPAQATENGISGRVVVVFKVGANGSLSDFRIRKGLGYGCDEEAIRLIQEGPSWQAGSSGSTEEVRVTINFKQ